MTHRTRKDRISLVGVKLYPRIGVTAEERNNPQECEADLTVWGNFRAAAAAGSLEKAVDYCGLLEKAQETADACEYNLMETLACEIAHNLLQGSGVSRVQVRLRKRPVSLRGKIDFIEVEVEEP